MKKFVGVPERSTVKTVSDGILYECAPFTNNVEMWFGSHEIKKCVKAIEDKTSYDTVIVEIPKGTEIKLNRLRNSNGMDTVFKFLEATIDIDGIETKCILYGFDISNLVGLEDA